MATISFTIDDAKMNKVVNGLKKIYPIPLDTNGQPEFTDNAWAKEVTRRWIVQSVARAEQLTAQQAIAFNPDDTLVS